VKGEAAQPGFLAVVGIQLRNKLIRRYTSRGARGYEERRKTARWTAENRAFEALYGKVAHDKVLDLPVGIGRWFEAYRASGASVHGVDISDNMLGEAAGKIRPGDDIRLEQADVLDVRRASPLERGYDLIVCTRFVYWLRPAELAIMLRKFHDTGAPHLIASAKVSLPEGQRAAGKSSAGLLRSLDRLRAHIYRSVVKRVYDEQRLLQIFRENGWNLVEQQPVVTTSHVRYFYYLFARAEP
jgi:SAM-dependent methyltransferase